MEKVIDAIKKLKYELKEYGGDKALLKMEVTPETFNGLCIETFRNGDYKSTLMPSQANDFRLCGINIDVSRK